MVDSEQVLTLFDIVIRLVFSSTQSEYNYTYILCGIAADQRNRSRTSWPYHGQANK